MAVKSLYLGSVGPFKYDDTDLVNDPDGKFVGETFDAVKSDGGLSLGAGSFDTLLVSTGAGDGKIMVSDASGNASWTVDYGVTTFKIPSGATVVLGDFEQICVADQFIALGTLTISGSSALLAVL
jgi:hypothetical protein